jgi:hypothetical protein
MNKSAIAHKIVHSFNYNSINEAKTNAVLVFLRSVRRLLVTTNVVSSSPILVTLMIEALSSSDTPILTRATRHNIPEDGIPHSHNRETLKRAVCFG